MPYTVKCIPVNILFYYIFFNFGILHHMDFVFLSFTLEPNSSPMDKFWIEATTHSSLNKGTHLFCQYLTKLLLKEDNEIKYPKGK